MRRPDRTAALLGAFASLLAHACNGCAAEAAAAPVGGGAYSLAWATIDAGGGRASADGYALTATLGQPEVDLTAIGGVYQLDGGFWIVAPPAADSLFDDGFEDP